MLWAVAVKRPEEGSIVRAERGGGGDFEGAGSLRGACPEAVVPEAESPNPARGVAPIIGCWLQAIQPSGRGKLGVDVSLAAHPALEISPEDTATGPMLYSGVRETVFEVGLCTTGWATLKGRGTWWSKRRVLPH